MTDYDGGRMVARRGGAWGWLESAYPEPLNMKRFSAGSIDCPNPDCGAPADTACSGPRVCVARVQEALRRIKDGTLETAPEPEEAASAEPCPECASGRHRTQRGSPKFCGDPGHRCSRIIPGTRKQCVAPVVTGTRYCETHALEARPPRRWADGAFAKA